MSRASASTNRNLSLTEELEKLEQSITLTLQGKTDTTPLCGIF
jgi:DASH complex subunit ASK1